MNTMINRSPQTLQSSRSGRRCVAWHVGRQGEVAGGMTQVVNAYKRWNFDGVEVRVLETRDGSSGFKAVGVFFKGLAKLLAIRSTQENLFVVHLSQGGSFVREGLMLVLARARGFGTVAHIHGSSFVAFVSRFPRLVRFVLSSASKVIVLSEASQECLSGLVEASKIELVPNAVAEGQPQEKEPLVVFGGSVSRRKGVDVLVQAWRKSGCGKGWRLVIAGPLIDKDVVPEALEDAEFMGSVSHQDLMALLERSAIAVLPSRDEAMPMFILEAMGRDNCVISTRVGGIPAVLENGRGMLIDPGDVEQLARALDSAISDKDVRECTARTGRSAFDQSYSARAIYPRVERLWLGVLPTQSSPA